MPHPTKRRKAYRSKYVGDHAKLKYDPAKVAAVFGPLEAILNQLERDGTKDETPQGQAVYQGTDGIWYDSPTAIMGVIEAYEIHERRTGRSLNLEPLTQLANKLRYDVMIFDSETKACRECLARMKAETLEMTAGYARDLIKDFQIKEELQREVA